MSDYFEAEKDVPALRRARGAYIAALLDDLLPPMRTVARACGYAIAVHGSLQRDIDLIAVPWTAAAYEPEEFVKALRGAVAGVTGRAHVSAEWTPKPHGRQALTIITSGDAYIDLSIMPRVRPPEDGESAA